MDHVRLDREREREEEEQEAYPDPPGEAELPQVHAVPEATAGTSHSSEQEEQSAGESPYFPLGLAVSPEQPTHFNFDLFLFDVLRLPRGLFPEDSREPVHFSNVQECTEYCRRFVAHREQSLASSGRSGEDLSREFRNRLSKPELFHQSGRSLRGRLQTGNVLFDAKIADLRLDRFGNVMFLHAPPWSDISAQFTHGFPRRLIREPHGGILPGNLTVAARISNQAIRSLACGDVAAFASRDVVSGLGLTTSELVLARASALKYAGKRDKPARLLDLMLRFGIDFLTITPLSAEQISGLRHTTTQHWEQVLSTNSDSDASTVDSEDGGVENEQELSLAWDPSGECGEHMPSPASSTYRTRVSLHVTQLLMNYLSPFNALPGEDQQPAAAESTATTASQRRPGSSGRSGQRRKRGRTSAAAATETVDSLPEQAGADDAPEEETRETAPPDARAILLSLPGLAAARVPSADSLARLTDFLDNNQPTTPPEHEPGEGELLTSLQRNQSRYRSVREDSTREAVQQLWEACKADCLCEGRPYTRHNSQESRREQNCPYVLADEDGGEVSRVTASCENEGCPVCMLMNTCELCEMRDLGVTKNGRLTVMLQMSQFLTYRLNAEGISPEQRERVLAALCRLLCCGQTRVRNISSVGFLVQLCPRLLHLQLRRGWGNFWNEMSKVGVAVGYQPEERLRLAVLAFIRNTCVPDPSSPWHYYLQPEDPPAGND